MFELGSETYDTSCGKSIPVSLLQVSACVVKECGYMEACGNSGLAESRGRCWGGSMHRCGTSMAVVVG